MQGKRLNYKQNPKSKLPDEKLFCFYELFLKMKIDLNRIEFKKYTKPSCQIHSIMYAFVNSEKDVDWKRNAIFNYLERIKDFGNKDLNSKNVIKADYLFINIINQLFDNKFPNRDWKNITPKEIRETINWVNDKSYFQEQLTIIYYAYTNANLEICHNLSEIASRSIIKFDEFFYNIELLSNRFINSLPKESYYQIIKTLTENNYVNPKLNETFYQYAKDFCEKNPHFFSTYSSFYLFFLSHSQEVIKEFGIEEIMKMSKDELKFLTNQPLQELNEIKLLRNLGVPLSKIETIFKFPKALKLTYIKTLLLKERLIKKTEDSLKRTLTKIKD